MFQAPFKKEVSITIKDLNRKHYLHSDAKFYAGKRFKQDFDFPNPPPTERKDEQVFMTGINTTRTETEKNKEKSLLSQLKGIPLLKLNTRSQSDISLPKIHNTVLPQKNSTNSLLQQISLLKKSQQCHPSEYIETLTSQNTFDSQDLSILDQIKFLTPRIIPNQRIPSSDDSKMINKQQSQQQIKPVLTLHHHSLTSSVRLATNPNFSQNESPRLNKEGFPSLSQPNFFNYPSSTNNSTQLKNSIQLPKLSQENKALFINSSVFYASPYSSLQEHKTPMNEQLFQSQILDKIDEQEKDLNLLESLMDKKDEIKIPVVKKRCDYSTQTKQRVISLNETSRSDLRNHLQFLAQKGLPDLFNDSNAVVVRGGGEGGDETQQNRSSSTKNKKELEIMIAKRQKDHIKQHMNKVNNIVERLDGERTKEQEAQQKLKKATKAVMSLKKFNVNGSKSQRQYQKDLEKFNSQMDNRQSIFVKELYYKLEEFVEESHSNKRASSIITSIKGFSPFIKEILFVDDLIRTELSAQILEKQITSVIEYYKQKNLPISTKRIGGKMEQNLDGMIDLEYFYKNLCEYLEKKQLRNKTEMQTEFKEECNQIQDILKKYILSTDLRKQHIKNQCFKDIMVGYEDTTPNFILKNIPLENIKYLEKEYGKFEKISSFVREKDNQISKLCRMYTHF